jgi:hypothetical protein
MRRAPALLTTTALAALGLTAGALAAASPAAAAGPCGTLSTAPAYKHVVWIWMENHSYSDIIGNTSQAPYLNALAGECGLATNYHPPPYFTGDNGFAGIAAIPGGGVWAVGITANNGSPATLIAYHC